MDYLAQRKLIVVASRRDVLTNHLALIAPAASTVRLAIRKGFPLAQALGDGRLADRRARGAGRQVWAGGADGSGRAGQRQRSPAPAENVRGALAFVAQGEGAARHRLPTTDAKTEPKVKIVGLFPDDSIRASSTPPPWSPRRANPGAAGYLAFLQGPRASAIFQRYGFIVLPRPS